MALLASNRQLMTSGRGWVVGPPWVIGPRPLLQPATNKPLILRVAGNRRALQVKCPTRRMVEAGILDVNRVVGMAIHQMRHLRVMNVAVIDVQALMAPLGRPHSDALILAVPKIAVANGQEKLAILGAGAGSSGDDGIGKAVDIDPFNQALVVNGAAFEEQPLQLIPFRMGILLQSQVGYVELAAVAHVEAGIVVANIGCRNAGSRATCLDGPRRQWPDCRPRLTGDWWRPARCDRTRPGGESTVACAEWRRR